MQTVTKSLDIRGKTITTFVVFDVVAQLRMMVEGDVLELITDQYEPIWRDISAWSEATGQKLLSVEEVEAGRRFLIEKGTADHTSTRMAMVVSSSGLEELLSPLGFALAAALEGIDLNLFIQGPAVRVLTKDYRPRLKGWARPFSRFAAAGMAKTGHISPQNKLRQIHGLGGNIYMCGPSMEHFKVKREELIFDDLPIVEYFTFMSIMEKSDIQLYS